MLTVALVAIVALVIAAASIAVSVRLSKKAAGVVAVKAAKETTRHVIANEVWPHPLCGRTVAYRNAPHVPIGDVVHVDGSGRARSKRLASGTLVRRKLDRITEVS